MGDGKREKVDNIFPLYTRLVKYYDFPLLAVEFCRNVPGGAEKRGIWQSKVKGKLW